MILGIEALWIFTVVWFVLSFAAFIHLLHKKDSFMIFIGMTCIVSFIVFIVISIHLHTELIINTQECQKLGGCKKGSINKEILYKTELRNADKILKEKIYQQVEIK